jgi:hypothetical protein
MNFKEMGLLGLVILPLGGCASIVEGTTETVAVTTPPADGAKCVLKSSEGTYYVTTPGNALVHKTKNDLTVECDKDGFQHASLKVPAKFGATTLGNVLAGGVIGIGVDAATGANYSYPTAIAVPMASNTATPAPAVATPAPATVSSSAPTSKPTS